MNNRKKVTALFIAVILIFEFIPLFVSGASIDADGTENNIDAGINYSDILSETYAELSAAELLCRAANVNVTEAEEAYLSGRGITLKYSDNVPEGSVVCTAEDGGFVITASPCSYEASNGATVNRIPASVTVNGVTKTFSDGVYEAEFTGLEDGQTYEIVTEYVAEITVPVEALTALANAGYGEGRRVTEMKKDYADALEQYERDEKEYEKISVCKKSMEALESVFVSDSEGHVMYDTLNGSTVATVIANRDQLIDYGVPEKDLDDADEATKRLIAVLTPYDGLTTEKERFNYYKENYEEIKSQFARLYTTLHSFANIGLVRMELTKKGKIERYYQFVSQLYVISAGLDDDLTYSEDWNIRGRKVTEFIESVQMVTDNDRSSPEDLTYPEDCEITEPPVCPEEPVFTEQQLLLESEVINGVLNERIIKDSRPLTFTAYVCVTAATPKFIKGDVNGDDAVNNKDVVALFRAVSDFDSEYVRVHDFNEDGAVNNKDVVALFRYVSAF